MRAITLPIVRSEWHFISCAHGDPVADEAAAFWQWCWFERPEFSWGERLGEILRVMLRDGFSAFEPWWNLMEWEGKRRWCLGDLAPRPPRTIAGWVLDDRGEPTHAIQRLDGKGDVKVPIVLFTHEREGGEFEGVSILRSLFQSLETKHRTEQNIGIMVERGVFPTPQVMVEPGTTEAEIQRSFDLATRYRFDEQAGAAYERGTELSFVAAPMDGVQWGTDFVRQKGHDIHLAIGATDLNTGDGDNGSHALARVRRDSRLALARTIALMVARIVRDKIIREAHIANFGSIDSLPLLAVTGIDDIPPMDAQQSAEVRAVVENAFSGKLLREQAVGILKTCHNLTDAQAEAVLGDFEDGDARAPTPPPAFGRPYPPVEGGEKPASEPDEAEAEADPPDDSDGAMANSLALAQGRVARSGRPLRPNELCLDLDRMDRRREDLGGEAERAATAALGAVIDAYIDEAHSKIERGDIDAIADGDLDLQAVADALGLELESAEREGSIEAADDIRRSAGKAPVDPMEAVAMAMIGRTELRGLANATEAVDREIARLMRSQDGETPGSRRALKLLQDARSAITDVTTYAANADKRNRAVDAARVALRRVADMFPEIAAQAEGIATGVRALYLLDTADVRLGLAKKLAETLKAEIKRATSMLGVAASGGGSTLSKAELRARLIDLGIAAIRQDIRSAVSVAIGLGRRAEIERSDVALVEYSNAPEPGVCGACEIHDGEVVEVGSPEYNELYPPYHGCLSTASGENRCRCIFVPVT